MDIIIQAIILGIIQGVTEFIPISSSAHLAVFPWLFNWTEISPSFDLALHVGTLLALIVFFFKDGIELIKNGFAYLIVKISSSNNKGDKAKLKIDGTKEKNGKMFWYIVAATIPAGILSLILDKISEKIIGENITVNIILIAIASIIMGLLLYFVDKKSNGDKLFKDYSFKHTMLIGMSQAFAAAFPGVSRSGVTITTSRKLGYDRESSAKLSFLLSIPIVLAGVLVKIKDFDFTYAIAFVLGIVFSFVVGLIVIKALFIFLKNNDYKAFSIYRVVFGILLLIGVIIRMFI